MRFTWNPEKARANRRKHGVSFEGEDSVAVVLDPDVASVFSSSESVNALLRSVIAALPEREQKRAAAGAGK